MKNFLTRNRNRIVIGGLVVSGGVLAFRYAQRKLHEYQVEQAKLFLERTRRTQHFEATERTCNCVITNLAPTLCEEILKVLNTDEILEQLRKAPENKAALWNELKVISFARLATLVYASSMLVIALRVEMNLLGGYLYKDNATEDANASPRALSKELQQIYLGEIEYFLKTGVAQLASLITDVTRRLLRDSNLKEQLGLNDLEQIFWSIQMSVNSHPEDPVSHMNRYFFGGDAADVHNPVVKKLLDETADVLENEEVSGLAASNVSRGFSVVMDHLAEYLVDTAQEEQSNAVANGTAGGAGVSSSALPNATTIRMALARVIPIVSGLAAKPFDMTATPPNLATALVTLYMLTEKVKTLGVNVYELFSL